MKSELKIVILPRGWVMVGRCHEDEKKLYMAEGSVIRKWGTTEGLPQIANNGPTKGTILDGKCKMEFPLSSVIATLECDEKAWDAY